MIKPKRMNSLIKGDKFDKVRDRKLTNSKRILLVKIKFQCLIKIIL